MYHTIVAWNNYLPTHTLLAAGLCRCPEDLLLHRIRYRSGHDGGWDAPPALYAVGAMGAVFASAARAPLTSLASVVEMSGDFSLTLPVMLAVAVASMVSRALSYGTIYTTKLLRRATDIDRAAPWHAVADLKVTDVMRPFRPVLSIPPDGGAKAGTTEPGGARLPR